MKSTDIQVFLLAAHEWEITKHSKGKYTIHWDLLVCCWKKHKHPQMVGNLMVMNPIVESAHNHQQKPNQRTCTVNHDTSPSCFLFWNNFLVGGFQPIWKKLVKMGIFPQIGKKMNKYLKPPPSNFWIQHDRFYYFWAWTIHHNKTHHLGEYVFLAILLGALSFFGWLVLVILSKVI